MVLTVVSNKGGTGKSTTVATLARLWALRAPLVLDTDRNNSISTYHLPGAEMARCSPDKVASRLKRVARSRLVLIDCPSIQSIDSHRQAIQGADIVLIPMQAEPTALKATRMLMDELRRDEPAAADRARVLITMVYGGVTGNKAWIGRARAAFGDSLLQTTINRQATIARALDKLETILDYAPDSIAARQYTRLGEELLNGTNTGSLTRSDVR